MTGLLLTGVVLYLVGPLVFVMGWLIDLWAKSYDLPAPRVFAKLCLSVLLGMAAAGYTWVACLMLDLVVHPVAVVAVGLGLIPPALALLCTAYDVNWRLAYAGAAVGSFVTWAAMPRSAFGPGVSMTLVAATLACWVYSEVPSVRFARYERLLRRGCSCCGYQQRAVHELLGFGSKGEAVVDAYLNGRESWQDGRVRDELRMCRLTNA